MKKSVRIVVISVINCYICKVVQTQHYILEAFGFVPTGTEVEDARTFLLHDTFKVNLISKKHEKPRDVWGNRTMKYYGKYYGIYYGFK